MFIDDLGNYIESHGHGDVYRDYHPESDEYTAIFIWDKQPHAIYDGTAEHFVQIQVKSKSYAKAMKECTQIAELLDSGAEERTLDVSSEYPTIGRIRRLPTILERTPTTTTVYAELGIWAKI